MHVHLFIDAGWVVGQVCWVESLGMWAVLVGLGWVGSECQNPDITGFVIFAFSKALRFTMNAW